MAERHAEGRDTAMKAESQREKAVAPARTARRAGGSRWNVGGGAADENSRVPGPPVQAGGDWSVWPTYNAAVLGFRGYWYPTVWASQVGKKPMPITVCGERIVLVRDGAVVRALHDRCPHRGVPLSFGRREFDGTLSCP